MSLRDSILALQDLQTQRVDVPEWGQSLTVRTLTAAELDDYEASIIVGGDGDSRAKPSLANVRAKLVVRCVVDDGGNRVFADGDAAELGKKSSKAIDRLYAVAAKLNGRTPGDVKELAKNSGGGQVSESISA